MKLIFLICIISLFYSCGLPEDPQNTFKKIKERKALTAGISENPPFVFIQDSIGGREIEIIKSLAEDLGVEINWVIKTENELFKQLEEIKIDIAACGLTKDTPWKNKIGLTIPYHKDKNNREYVMAVPPGENKWLMFVEKHLKRWKNEN